MVPRARMRRRVSNPPEIKGFKPYGGTGGKREGPLINLLFEEYEALRLCDYDHYNHQEAADMMCVSRPTFTRIYASALRKIAEAFVEGRGIAIEGGHVYFDSDWYYCNGCESNFNNPERDVLPATCPLCGDAGIEAVGANLPEEHLHLNRTKLVYFCEGCGIEQSVDPEESHFEQLCQLCHAPMKQIRCTDSRGLNQCI
jgi:predicted DNA-binding protein (UPF0251 family)